MISLTSGLDTLSRAQTLVDNSAKRISGGSLEPQDTVDLISGKNQFSAGTKLIQTEDTMTKALLDVFG